MPARDLLRRASSALGASFALRVLYYAAVFLVAGLIIGRPLLPFAGEGLQAHVLSALILGLLFSLLHAYLFGSIFRRRDR